MLGKLIRFLLAAAYVVFGTLLVVEVGLRLVPSAVPLKLLLHFDPDIRATIAREINLTVERDMVTVPRDDRGPNLWLYPAHYEDFFPYRDETAVKSRKMDGHGFCNPPQDASESDQLEVVSLGDSLTWCTGVAPDETFSSYLFAQTGLRGANLSRFKTGLYEYLQFLKNFGLGKNARIVILNVTGTNDLRDALRYWKARNTEVAAEKRSRELTGPASWLMHNSYVTNLLWALAERQLPKLGRRLENTQIDYTYTLVRDGREVAFNVENADLDEVRYARMLREGEIELALVDEALETFKQLSDEHGFVPLVTFIPSAFSGYWPDVRFTDPALQELMPWFTDQHHEHLLRKTEELGLPYLDLTPALRAAAAERSFDDLTYFPYNRHLTPEGHRVVAARLAEEVQRLLSSPKDAGPSAAP
jgi:hypothetical protein